jgi:hypothetical protein
MKKFYLVPVIFFTIMIIPISCRAAIIWSWDFVTNEYTVTPSGEIVLEAIIFNDSSSDEDLWVGSIMAPVYLCDDNFVSQGLGDTLNVKIAPGESYTFHFDTYKGMGNSMSYNWGYSINTFSIYNWVQDGNHIVLDNQKTSLSGISVRIVPTPSPSSIWILFSGIICIVFFCRKASHGWGIHQPD